MNFFKLLLPIWILLIVSGCSGKSSDLSDYDMEVYTPEYASGFRIVGNGEGESVVIESMDPWQGADSVITRLFISRNGEEPPAEFDGQVLSDNAERLVVMSSSHIAFLDVLAETRRVVGVSCIDYISSPLVKSGSKLPADVGYEGNINYELLLGQNPDIVLLYGTNGANPMEKKLNELGIPYIYIGDYLEEDPLGKAEWLVAIAEIIGKRTEGIDKFAEIPAKYLALKRKVEEYDLERPSVMLNTPYGGTWFMPSVKSYAVRLIEDAGGEYIYRKNTGNSSDPIDMEKAYELVSKADFWLNTGRAKSLAGVAAVCPKFTDTEVYRKGKVFNNNARDNDAGGNDYWESGVVHPDIILRDLVRIFHPDLVEDELVYYKQLR